MHVHHLPRLPCTSIIFFAQSDIAKMVKHMFLQQILKTNVYKNGGVNSVSTRLERTPDSSGTGLPELLRTQRCWHCLDEM